MHRHLAAGDGYAALRQYEHLERLLARELGVDPGEPARRARLEALRRLPATGRPQGSRRAEALRAELADLVRRQHVLVAELHLLDPEPPELITQVAV